MKGNDKVVAALNDLLADELTAIVQYMVHSEMCANWEYERLHARIERRAVEEMKHAEKHIGRILFLEGQPTVHRLNKVNVGPDVAKQFEHDRQAETDAIRAYNAAIRLCVDHADNGTREMLEGILEDEESHLDWLEAQLDQVAQIGLASYLEAQIRKPE